MGIVCEASFSSFSPPLMIPVSDSKNTERRECYPKTNSSIFEFPHISQLQTPSHESLSWTSLMDYKVTFSLFSQEARGWAS